MGVVPTGSSIVPSGANMFAVPTASNAANLLNISVAIASICSGVKLLAGVALTLVTLEAARNMSAIASAVILFTKLRFLILFSLVFLRLSEHRRASGLSDGDGL